MDIPSYVMGKRAGSSITEIDPTVPSHVKGITENDITNWNGKQNALTAGNNISISDNTISATDTTYNDATTSASGLMSSDDKTKLNGIASGAEVNVQSNWNETDSASDSYIQNKPTIPDIVQYSTMPTASIDNLDKIVQYIGTTVANSYTNGYFYKCVSDGGVIPVYSWENIDVQAGGGGASYTAGTNIEITSGNVINNTIDYQKNVLSTATNASIALGKLKSNATLGNLSQCVIIGENASKPDGNNTIAIGNNVGETYNNSVAIGNTSSCGSYSTSVGFHAATGRSYTVAIGSGSGAQADNAIAIGGGALAYGSNSIAIGRNCSISDSNVCAIGSNDMKINRIYIHTSNGVKDLATENFVTNYLSTITGYDNTKTQVLKNVNGTLTWVDE